MENVVSLPSITSRPFHEQDVEGKAYYYDCN